MRSSVYAYSDIMCNAENLHVLSQAMGIRFHKLSFVSEKHFHFLAAILSLYVF